MTNNPTSLYGDIEGGGTKFVCATGSTPDDIRAEIRIPTRMFAVIHDRPDRGNQTPALARRRLGTNSRPASLAETTASIYHVQHDHFLQERQRVRIHRATFRLHTHSVRQSERQLKKLVQRWKNLPASHDP